MSKKDQNIFKVLGLALGLPSTILGVFALIYYLAEEKKIISYGAGLSILLVIIGYTFYLIIKNSKSDT